jgi:hypothetical protein
MSSIPEYFEGVIMSLRARFTMMLALTVLTLAIGLEAVRVGAAENGISEIGAWHQGPLGAYACGDGVMYASSGPTLQTWNIQDAANPVLTDEIEYAGAIHALAFHGDWLVGVGAEGFMTLDLSDPYHPVHTALIEYTSYYTQRLCVGDGFAYVAAFSGELTTYDLTDPAVPVEAGSEMAWGDVNSLTYDNGLVYMSAAEDMMVWVFDVSDPYNIGMPDEYMAPDMILPDGLFAKFDVVHVFTESGGWLVCEVDGLDLIELEVVTDSTITAHHFKGGVMGVVEDGLYNIYVLPPGDSPMLVSTVDPGLEGNIQALRFHEPVFIGHVDGQFINIFDDVADAHHDCYFSDHAETGGLYGDLYVTGKYDTPRLSFYDIGDPADVTPLGTLDLPAGAYQLTVSQGYAVASCNNSGAVVVDLTSGAPFDIRDTIAIAGRPEATAFHDGLLYISSSDDFVASYDLSVAGSPVEVGSVATTGYARDLEFIDDTLLFMGSSTITSYDISDPADPVLTDELDVAGGSLYHMAIVDDTIYIACGSQGLKAVDMAPGGELSYLRSHDTSELVFHMVSMDSRLYASANADGVMVFEGYNPWNIPTLFQHETLGSGRDVDMWERVFVVANDDCGFTIFQDDEVTPIHLSEFTADRARNGATVAWRVFADTGDAAFHVWRGSTAENRTRVTETPLTGASRYTWFDAAAPTTATRYWLEETIADGTSYWYGPIDLAAKALPLRPVLHEPWPNPFNPSVALRVELPAPARLVVTIHDLRGRRVATLADGHREAGEIVLRWHGNNDAGQPMNSGVYFARMTTESTLLVKKMMLVR